MRVSDTPKALEIARAIALHLPDWIPNPVCDLDGNVDFDRADLVGSGGATICLLTSRHEAGRVRVSGRWPRLPDGGHYYPGKGSTAITCSAGRDPRALAKDIERRFLPGYLAEYAKAVEYCQARGRGEAAAIELATRIGDVIGTNPGQLRNGSVTVLVYLAEAHGRIEVTAGSPPSVSLNLGSVTPDQALRIAEVLAEGRKDCKDQDTSVIAETPSETAIGA